MKISGGSVNCSVGGSALNESKLAFLSNAFVMLALPLLLPGVTFTLPPNILPTVSAPLCEDCRTNRSANTCHETDPCGYQRDPNRRSTHRRIIRQRD